MRLCRPALAEPVSLPAFRGAQGFGALATGGRGDEVVHVTNLDGAGPGSLREAVSEEKRVVVFDVGGVIEITSPLVIASNVTVAGQSAPGEGITVYGDSVSCSNRQHIVVRYLRLRQGVESRRGSKVINISGGKNMIFDHVSASWGRWDILGVTQNSESITFQHCLFAEAIDPQRFGGLIDGARGITLLGNLWMNNQSRNPKIKGDLQYINNVVYNWGASGVPGGHSGTPWHQDVANNLFIKGPSSIEKFFDMFASTDHVHQAGNLADMDADGVLNPRPVTQADFHGQAPPTFEAAPSQAPPVVVLGVEDAYRKVLAGGGASLVRDAVDQRLIAQRASLGTKGAIIGREQEAGGQPRTPMVTRSAGFDGDRDGMADAWERGVGLHSNGASDANLDGDGYSNLEEYLGRLSGDFGARR